MAWILGDKFVDEWASTDPAHGGLGRDVGGARLPASGHCRMCIDLIDPVEGVTAR